MMADEDFDAASILLTWVHNEGTHNSKPNYYYILIDTH